MTADAFDAVVQRRVPTRSSSELSADGSALLYSTYLGGTQSEGGNDIALDASGDVYVAGHTYSIDFPTTAGAFDTVFNGDPSIFWGDAFVDEARDRHRRRRRRRRRRRCRPHRRCSSPANGDDAAAADHVRLERRRRRGVVHDSDRRFERVHRAARARAEPSPMSMYATSGLATTPHFWRVRGVNSAGVAGAVVGGAELHARRPRRRPPTLSTLDTNPSTVVGGNRSSGTVVLSTRRAGGRRADRAVEQQSGGGQRAGDRRRLRPTASRRLHDRDVAGGGQHDGHHHRDLQRHDEDRDADGHAADARRRRQRALQSLALNPSSVVGGSNAQGAVILSGAAPQGGAVVALSSSNPGVAGVPGERHGAAGAHARATFTVTTTAVQRVDDR